MRAAAAWLVIALAGGAVCGPVSAQQAAPALSLEHRMLLRCSAAFALVAGGQASGDAAMLAYPLIGARGREFFVRSAARVMDEAQLDRAAAAQALHDEAAALRVPGTLAQVMPVCLALLPPA